MDCCSKVRGADCHCARCHQTFSSLRLFDKHQDVDHERQALRISDRTPTPMVLCVAPARLGLVQDYRGTWTTPEAAASRLRSASAAPRRMRKAVAA